MPTNDERTLSHASRQQILAFIKDRPGLKVTEVLASLGIPQGTLDFHLEVLRREGLVVFAPFPGGSRLLPKDQAAGENTALLVHMNNYSAALVLTACAIQGAMPEDHVRALLAHRTRRQQTKLLAKLESDGLLTSTMQRSAPGQRWSCEFAMPAQLAAKVVRMAEACLEDSRYVPTSLPPSQWNSTANPG